MIDKNELQTPRTAREYLPWVESKIEELGQTDVGKKAMRLGQGLAKELVEEALPLSIFARKHYGESRSVIIRHYLGNQNFDAKVVDKRMKKSPIKYIEVTQAHEGQTQHYRMVALERDGHVNVLGKVKKSGTKHTGIIIEVENEARSHNKVHLEELEKISKAIQKKLAKTYLDNTALVVAFDDYIAIRSDEDMDSLHKYLLANLLGHIKIFRWLALVGWGKQNFLEYDLGK